MLVGVAEPKSRPGRRTVPIAAPLRGHLLEHRLRSGCLTGLIFGRTAETPFEPVSVRARVLAAWGKTDPKLEPIGLHVTAPLPPH